MAGTIYDALVNLDFKDNDVPGQMARVVQQLEREIAGLSTMPEVNLGAKLVGSLGEGVTLVGRGVQRLKTTVSELAAESSRLNSIDPRFRTEGTQLAITKLHELTTGARQTLAALEALRNVQGPRFRLPVTPEQQAIRETAPQQRLGILRNSNLAELGDTVSRIMQGPDTSGLKQANARLEASMADIQRSGSKLQGHIDSIFDPAKAPDLNHIFRAVEQQMAQGRTKEDLLADKSFIHGLLPPDRAAGDAELARLREQEAASRRTVEEDERRQRERSYETEAQNRRLSLSSDRLRTEGVIDENTPNRLLNRISGRTFGRDSVIDEQVIAAAEEEGLSRKALAATLREEAQKAKHRATLESDQPNTPVGKNLRDADVLTSAARIVEAQNKLATTVESENTQAEKAAAARRKADAQASAVAKTVEPLASPGIQLMQAQLGIERANLRILTADNGSAQQSAEAVLSRAKINVLENRIMEAKNRELRQIELANRPTGFLPSLFGTGGGRGGGFGVGGGIGSGGGGILGGLANEAGFAAKYYALYRGFSLIEETVRGVKTATEEYTISVNNLSIALGSNYAEASRAAEEYSRIGAQMATAPTVAVDGATKFTRSFRNEDGSVDPSAGRFGASVTSLINVLEGPTKLTTTMESLVAVTKAYGLGAGSAGSTYDQATRIGQVYGVASAGELLPGVAQIADLGKASGFSMDQLLALTAASMQSTGLTSDAVAGDIKRFLGADQGPLDKTLGALGGDTNQNLAGKLQELAAIISKLPAERQDAALQGLGGSRSAATVRPFIEALAKLDATTNSANNIKTATEQANDKLRTLGGAFQQLSADAQQLYTALSQSGAGELFGALVMGLHDLLLGFTEVVRLTNQVSPALRGLGAAIITLAAASAAAARIRGVNNSLLIGGLLPTGGMRGASEWRAAQAAVPLQQFGPGGSALSGAQSGIANLAARTAGLGGAALTAVAQIGPLIAVIAALGAIGAGTAAKAKATEGVNDAYNSRLAADKAIESGDVEGIRAQAQAQRDAREKIIAAGQGFGGNLATFSENAKSFVMGGGLGLGQAGVAGASFTGVQTARDTMTNNMLRYAKELEAEADKAEETNKARDAAARAFNFSPTFGEDYANISEGIKKVIGLGTTPGVELNVMRDLVTKGVKGSTNTVDPLQLQKLFSATDGDKNISDLYQDFTTKSSKQTDPLARVADLKRAHAYLDQLNEEAKKAGDAATADAASQLLAQSSAALDEAVITVLKARIASIKALQGDTKQSRAQITGLVQSALATVAASGNVEGVATILAGVDKAFINTFIKQVNTELSSLKGNQVALVKAQAVAAAAAAAMQEITAATAGSANAAEKSLEEARTPGSANAEEHRRDTIAGAKDAAQKAKDKADAGAKRIKDLQTEIDTIEKAKPVSAPDNSFFDFGKDKGPTAEDIELARLQSLEIPGDPLSAAQTAKAVAQYQMKTAKDKAAWYQALKALNEADYQLAQVLQEQANNQALLTIDITDPVAQARQRVTAAKAKLAADQSRGALGDVITADKVALRQSQSDAEKAAFDQKFSDERTNYELQRTSLSAYLSYLRSQHDYLTSVKNKTRQQVDELNQVDQALKSLADGLQGQFNLGDIRIPAPYEVRRAMAGGGNYAATQSTQYVTITINGNDTAAMKNVLAQYMGQGVMMAVASAPRKV